MSKSGRSEKSSRSVKSPDTNYTQEIFVTSDNLQEVNFSEIIVGAIGKVGCPVSVVVDNVLDTFDKKQGRGKIRQKNVPLIKTDSKSSDTEKEPIALAESTLKITATHDTHNRLVEISMNKYRFCVIPRIIMQILRYILPKYPKLTKFCIKDCCINKCTIFELKNLLSWTRITDVCLDSTFLTEGNYDILLEQATSLRHLSLRRCRINDEVCQRIFSHLDSSKPVENFLLTLNLSSNQITDVGAKSVGEILRKNRHLRYLNLADNQITDDGASYILDALKEFPLTYDEIIDKRTQYMKYLQNKHVIQDKCLKNVDTVPFEDPHIDNVSKKSTKKKKASGSHKNETPVQKSDEFNDTKGELMPKGLAFEHPFSQVQVKIKNGYPYCMGNLILSYLNLAYNNLMYPSLKKLLLVLECQRSNINTVFCGLMQVVLEGNNLPEQCVELDCITDILSRRIIRNYSEYRSSRKKEVGVH